MSTHERELEYQALRRFIKIMDSPQTRLEKNIGMAIREELTTNQQMMIYYYYIQQMTMKEIAGEMNVCISTVSRTLKRAKDKLRRCLRYGGQALLDMEE